MFQKPKQIADDKIKEIEFWTLQLSSFSPYINSVIQQYEALHPNIKIKWIDVPFSEGEKRALASILSNEVPDLVNMNPDFAVNLADKKALTDLKPLILMEIYNQYLTPAWQSCEVNGKIYGVPWYITSSVTLRNKKLLAQAGLAEDYPIKTYDDLAKIAEKIKISTGKYVLMPTLTENGKIIKLFNQSGIPIINENKTKALFNTQKAFNILDFWGNMYTKRYIPAESLSANHRESLEKFQSGETAFLVAGANFLKIIHENAPQLYPYIDVTEQITGDTGKFDFAIMNLVIPVKSTYPKEALDFALFLTNAENQLEFCKLAPILPSVKKSLESSFFKEEIQGNIASRGRVISAGQLTNLVNTVTSLPNQKDLYEIADFMTQNVLLNRLTSKQAVKTAEKEWDKLLLGN